MKYGILIVSHVPEIAQGVSQLVAQAAPDISITYTGGTEEGQLGSSFELIQQAVQQNQGAEILAFYDLGSSKMNLEMVQETTTKVIHKFDVALVEGAYTAGTLAQIDSSWTTIAQSLKKLQLRK